ncbi:DUF3393 domain-containing protein [Bowmanella sp. Y26]|uniref:murein transglycosylase domain-containing protein n=1 Tax=Bowmanella yangjiangensis TaxID=2811230 RepID=UPI001BDBC5C9|nr:murein transglycosylase domain-containing protein [Bowmanella yangjiangensis]MBT1064009.1 DUF3393 domain-containing protein [Bowmanella yangjiangensis]
MKFVKICLLGPLFLMLVSCQSTFEGSVKEVSKVMSAVKSSTVRTVTDIAASDSPGKALQDNLGQRAERYKDDPEAILRDMDQVKADFKQLLALFRSNVGQQWGKAELRVATQKQYVKYTQNYLSRAIVDFDKGEILVETLDQTEADKSLLNAIVTTLLTPDDPRAVDLFSDKTVTLSSAHSPYLAGLVLDAQGKTVDNADSAEQFANYLLHNKRQQRELRLDDGAVRQATYVQFSLINNFSHEQARKYSPLVARYAEKYQISANLIYAMIRAESNFNPFAVSAVPAYGLMQLVPSSGGRDAYKLVHGQDSQPSKDFLFNAGNNIELGAAYLHILTYQHLAQVQNQVSREYCVISAYNTGAGNVFKAFGGKRQAALQQINSQTPTQVYETLRRELPYEETRHYLGKVVDYRKQFIAPGK